MEIHWLMVRGVLYNFAYTEFLIQEFCIRSCINPPYYGQLKQTANLSFFFILSKIIFLGGFDGDLGET